MQGKGVTHPHQLPPPIFDFRFWISDLNPKPVLSEVEGSPIQNGGVAVREEIPCCPATVRATKAAGKPLSDETAQCSTVQQFKDLDFELLNS
jgi:hypothetical protein